MYELWKSNCLDLNCLLLKTYKGLSLNEAECLLLMCLAQVIKLNPTQWTFQDVSSQMTLEESECSLLFIQLVEKKFVQVTSKTDDSGKRYEEYSLLPLFGLIEQQLKQQKTKLNTSAREEIFTLLEQQLGILSPIDIETIHMWLTDDQFDPELIKLATYEMNANQVKSIRYIDKILLEWKHKNIVTVEEAKRQLINFRQRKASVMQPSQDAPVVDPTYYYDWMNE